MLPAGEVGETPDVEDDVHGDAESETGHDEPGADEGDDIDGERDPSGGAGDDLEDDDAGADDGQAGQSHQVGGKGRAGDTIRALRTRAQQAEERAIRAEAAAEERQRHQPQRDPAVAAAEREAKLALMSPDERTDFLVGEAKQEFTGAIQQLHFQNADTADKMAFDGICARDPVADKYRERVDAELLKMRRTGNGSAPREAILNFLVGQDARAKAREALSKQGKRGKENIQRHAGKPAAGRSDIRGADERRSGNDKSARAKRLTNVNL